MGNRFNVGMARLLTHLETNAAVNIIYHKLTNGVDTAVPLVASVDTYLFKILEKDNQRMEWSDRDYLIPVAKLSVGVTLFLPHKEHWIEELLPEGTVKYRLSAPENESVWRYNDVQHTQYRIHTKRAG